MKRRDFLEITALGGAALIMNKQIKKVSAKDFELEEKTITELQDAMKTGKLSAEKITRKYLDRIKEIDPKINSVIEINPDALKIAEQ